MNNNRKSRKQQGSFDASWIPVFIMLYFMWPIGLFMLYNKIKKTGDPQQRRRKPISWASLGLCGLGAMMILGGARHFMGLFALLGGAAVFGYSRKMKHDARKFDKYTSIIGNRHMAPISAIAAAMPCQFEEACADLQQMIDEGYFGQYAYLDHSNGMFVSDGRHVRASVDIKPEASPAPAVQKPAPAASEDEYQAKLNQIRKLNDAIQDEDISSKINRIEDITGNIFELVKQNPEKRSEIHTFMNYYLPTTFKLLESYSVLERQNVLGSNIVTTKASIEKMVDQLVWAFERQLDQMFEAEARDISTDITVLERMMARDGLSDNPYTLPTAGSAAAQQQQQQQQQ